MNIAIINPSLNCGGAEKVISELANFWVASGFNVTIITTDRGEKPYFPLDSKVKRVPILKGQSRTRLLSIPRKITSLLKLRRVVLELRPDIVFTFQEKTIIYTLISLLRTNLFTVAAVRNHPEYKKISLPFRILRGLIYKHASMIVVQTQGIANWFKERLNLETVIIANPIKQVSSSLNKSKKNTIYACGRLVSQKGFSNLVNIFYELESEWDLTIIGDGKERTSLELLIKNLQISERVTLEGAVENPSQYYKQGGIFVFTSEYEGFPNALCEAMACGMAVVSFDCPSGPSDLIEDGINGYLVTQGDEVEFRRKLELLINNESLRNKFGREAMKINEYLAIEKIAQQWLSLKETK